MRMNVSQGAKELIHIKFDQKNGDHLLDDLVRNKVEMFYSLPLLFHNFLQVCTNFRGPSLAPDLNTLHPEINLSLDLNSWRSVSYPFIAARVKKESKSNNIGMLYLPHN